MSAVDEIKVLEERLRQAELGPDPAYFEEHLADDFVLDGELAKAKVVDAHRPGKCPKFTKAEMSEFTFHDHGSAVVVTCKGSYESPSWSGNMRFMRVWLKKPDGWRIVAGSIW